MKVVTNYPDGIFSWVDLSSSDTKAAKNFYAGLFGWEAVDMDTDQGTIYTMFKLDGHNVAGLGPLDPSMQEQGIPSFWSSYVNHSNVDGIVEKAAAAGGTVLFPAMDVMEEGRMTMIQDPGGATFGVWQPKNHIGAQVVNHPNSLVWNELQTRMGEISQTFYQEVFGWEGQADESGYVTFSQDGRRHAGMILIDESWGPMPNMWATYFMVEDVEATAAKAQSLGGNILAEPTAAGEIGTFAVLQDPAGAVFTIIQFNGPTDPPPGH